MLSMMLICTYEYIILSLLYRALVEMAILKEGEQSLPGRLAASPPVQESRN